MKPDLTEEYALRTAGHARIAGIDEAGRGAWAGPVYAAAVVLPLDRRDLPQLLDGVCDSKLLSPGRREALLPVIRDVAEAVGVGWATPSEVDAVGIVPATRRAMARAVAGLEWGLEWGLGSGRGLPTYSFPARGGEGLALLIDHIHLPEVDLPQRSFPKADSQCLSVAAASIVAKVERDRVMVALEQDFPGYGFAAHKGYGTSQHREALRRLGPTLIHRMSWRPLRELSEA